jgi:gas vesicle protein
VNEPDRFEPGGVILFLAFPGGALVGGAAAVLLAPRSRTAARTRILDGVSEAKDVASRVPKVIREAASAAQAAFAKALEEHGEEAAVESGRRPSPVSR